MFSNKEYIYEVYKQRSFSKAAAVLYISQPSLSATIKKTEQKLGYPIFDRSTNPIRLTECGKEYISCVEQMLLLEKEFREYISDLSDLRTGEISIGASHFFSSYMLPPVFNKFKGRYPQVSIDLVETDTTSLEKLLFKGQLDLIVDNYHFSEELYKKLLFYSETLLLAVPTHFGGNTQATDYLLSFEDITLGKHLAPSTKGVPLHFFQHDPFVLLKHGNDTRVRSDKICKEQNVTPIIALELDQLATAYHIAYQGLGMTIVSDTLVKKVNYDDRLSFYKLDSTHTKRDIYLYYKRNKKLSLAAKAFLATAREK